MHCFRRSILFSFLFFNLYGAQSRGCSYSLMKLPLGIQQAIIAKSIFNDPSDVLNLCQVNRGFRDLTNAEVERNRGLIRWLYFVKKSDAWIELAKKAGIDETGKAPNHLLKVFLDLEKILFAEFLNNKESTIQDHPVKWKKHVLATLLSFYSNRRAIDAATSQAASSVGWGFFGQHPNYAAWLADRQWPSTAIERVELSGIFAFSYDAVRAAAWDTGRDDASNPARKAAEKAVDEAEIKRTAEMAVKDAAKNISHPYAMGRVAHWVAVAQAWITALDPCLKTFEKAYDASYLELENTPQEDLEHWFGSKEAFEGKIARYFVNYRMRNDPAGKSLEHLMDHLNRMILKVFPVTE